MGRPEACGVDGCRAGWFGVCFLAGGGWEAGLFPTLGGLWERWGSARLILIDMPIGLPGRGPADRDREREARRLLGVRRSSIFPVPCRPAVAASSETLALRAERRTAGRGLSRQSLALIPKIRELDRLLTLRPGSRRVLRESHPELCFLGMNGGQPLRFGKKSPEGREERLALLDARRPGSRRIAERCFRDHLRGTARDDILDALGLAVAARAPLRLLASVPSRAASRDSRGLPMRIVFVPFGDPDAGRRVVS